MRVPSRDSRTSYYFQCNRLPRAKGRWRRLDSPREPKGAAPTGLTSDEGAKREGGAVKGGGEVGGGRRRAWKHRPGEHGRSGGTRHDPFGKKKDSVQPIRPL